MLTYYYYDLFIYFFIYLFIYLFHFQFFIYINIIIIIFINIILLLYQDLAKQMLFDMRFQYDSLRNSKEPINLKMKPILNIQRRLWYCTYILHVFSMLNSNIPITSFIDSFLVPFPDDDKSFNEEITIPNNNMNNNYSNGNSMNDYNYELDKKNFPMASSFSFNENMNRGIIKKSNKYIFLINKKK